MLKLAMKYFFYFAVVDSRYMKIHTDEEIAVSVQKGDTEAFGFLVERYESKMHRYAKKFLFDQEEVQDLVQEVFIKAYIHINTFDTKRKFSSWLYRIAHNEYINALKKKTGTFTRLSLDVILPYAKSTLATDDMVHEADMQKIIDTCLSELDPKYREPMVLYFIEELSYKEIAEVLRIPASTVGVRITRAKNQLKKIYSKKFPTA